MANAWAGNYIFKISYNLESDASITVDVLRFGIIINSVEVVPDETASTKNNTTDAEDEDEDENDKESTT